MDNIAQTMSQRPLKADGRILYLLDARHSVERKHLLRCIAPVDHALPPEHQRDYISLSIADERTKRPLDVLAQKLMATPETLVMPIRIAWQIPNFRQDRAIKLRHMLYGDPRQPGALRARAILMRDKERAHILTGQPATIADLQERFRNQIGVDEQFDAMEFAAFVTRQAGLVLDIEERRLRGIRYKVPHYVADGILSSKRFRGAIKTLSDETGTKVSSLYDEAGGYFKELVARPTPLLMDIRAKFDRFVLRLGYPEGLKTRPDEVQALGETMRTHPTLVLFTHKTYLDGLPPSDIAYHNDLPMVHVFGGINLDIFGLGFLMRRAGTIFIRRNFDKNPLYKLVLQHYVSYLLDKRFPMTWAFEGTRSRLGKLMPPRYGLLKYVLDAAHVNDIHDVHIVPLVTSFDLIRDVDEYAAEQTGAAKKPESLKWLINYLRSLREPLGRVYVDIGKPVVVARAPSPDDKLALSKIAFEVAVQANNVTPLTLTSVMCLALLGTAPRGMTAAELRAGIEHTVKWAVKRGIRISDDLEPAKGLDLQAITDTLINSGLLVRDDQGPSVIFTIEPDKHPMASYYRNTIIHHFLNKAIVEMALLKARDLENNIPAQSFWAETERLRELFKFEFFYPEKSEYRANLEQELTLADADWQHKLSAGGPQLSALINRFQPLVCHAVFMPFVEAYTVVIQILARQQAGDAIDRKTLVEIALKEAHQAYLLRQITSKSSIGKILFENGFKMADSQGLIGEASAEMIAKRKTILRELRSLSRRMETARLKVLALADKSFD